MAEFSWAYIDSAAVLSASGPTGSIQYRVADAGGNTAVSGSSNFIFHTASNLLAITGSVEISGTLTANQYNINVIDKTVINLSASGDTIFGDTADDTHQFTGSVYVNGPLSASTTISATAYYGDGSTLDNISATNISGAMGQFNTTSGLLITSGNVYLGDGASDVTTVASQLTASQGALLATSTIIDATHVSSSLNISGSAFYGDGTNLAGVVKSAAGSNNQIQFNESGQFGASPRATIVAEASSAAVIVTGSVTVTGSASNTTTTIDGTHVSSSLNISGSSFYGDGTNLTGVVKSAAGSSGQIQYNNAGAFGAAASLAVSVSPGGEAAMVVTGSNTTVGSVQVFSGSTQIFGIDSSDSGLGGVIINSPLVQITGSTIISGTLTTTDDINLLDDKKLNLGDSADALIEYDANINKLAISGSATGIELMGGNIGIDYPGGTVVSGTAGGAGSFLALNSSHQVVVTTPAAGSTFPYTGNAVISGTLDVSGSIEKLGYIQLGRGADQSLLIDVSNPQVRPSTGAQDVVSLTSLTPTTTPIFVVEWDDAIRLDDSHYSSSATGIVVTETGDYKLSYSINYAQDIPNNARSNMKSFATVNLSGSTVTTGSAITVPFSHAYCYIRGDGGTNWGGDSGGNSTTRFGTGQCTTIMSASEGDTINLVCQFFGGATSGDFDMKLLANQTWIAIEKI